jgi:hypothetical protein
MDATKLFGEEILKFFTEASTLNILIFVGLVIAFLLITGKRQNDSIKSTAALQKSISDLTTAVMKSTVESEANDKKYVESFSGVITGFNDLKAAIRGMLNNHTLQANVNFDNLKNTVNEVDKTITELRAWCMGRNDKDDKS